MYSVLELGMGSNVLAFFSGLPKAVKDVPKVNWLELEAVQGLGLSIWRSGRRPRSQ